MTRACFEPASFFFSGSVMAGGFAVVARAAVDLGECFFEDFGIGILHSVYGGVAPHHHRSPTSANKPAGQDSWALMRPGLDDSTAPIADECQPFLDNVVAGFWQIGAWKDAAASFAMWTDQWSNQILRFPFGTDGHISLGHTPAQTPVEIFETTLSSFWLEELPSPQRQANNLILWIGDTQRTPGRLAQATVPFIEGTVGTAISEKPFAGWNWLYKQLEPKKLFELEKPGGLYAFSLTMAGWDRYDELNKTRSESRTGFMAMKFGDPILTDVVGSCFKPAVARTGFELRILTDKQPAGLIDNQMRAAILSARFVIADLTHGNQGAYWEAGFAEGLGLPVFYSCEESVWRQKKTHFDTNHMKTIIWNTTDLQKAADDLAATIRATLRADAKQAD
jgi:hypothetical protein